MSDEYEAPEDATVRERGVRPQIRSQESMRFQRRD
jgi:hypothetical protein